ncbi:MAG: transketolase C-terminal domain-containing protein [FCB group bacterium]|jgi:transketolase
MEYKYIHKSQFDNVLKNNISKYSKLELIADMCRYNCLVSVKKAGSGHLGSSFSAMDLIVYLYLYELNVLKEGLQSENRDIYFSSKGHDVPGLYSLFYALGFINKSKLFSLRRLGGLDGHPDVMTLGIEANTGSLGMGISKGKGMSWVKKYRNYSGRVFVLTGDGEFQEGQIYESLQATAHHKIQNLTVIMDRNKFQTDRLVDNVNNIEDLKQKVSSFGWYVTKCNGNDFKDIKKALDEVAIITDKPKFIIADTIKGKGVSFMEESFSSFNGEKMYKWHSGAPDDDSFIKAAEEIEARIKNNCELAKIDLIKYYTVADIHIKTNGIQKEYVTDAFGEELCRIAGQRDDLIVIDGDLSADCKLRNFESQFPDRFIENGIAEQDMVSTAGGLARMGLLPVVSSFSSFLTSRANEQIYNNACERTKIIYACNFAGLIPAGPGKSHQSVRDISLLGAIPNMTIIQPCNSVETKLALYYSIYEADENCAIRLSIGPSPGIIQLPPNYKLEFGRGITLREGDDAIIFAYGPVMLHEALTASELLHNNGYGLKVVNMPWLNKIKNKWLYKITEGYKKIYVLEDHSIFGGLGDRILYELMTISGLSGFSFKKFGLEEYPECGTPQEVLKYHKLDGMSLAEIIFGENITNGINIQTTYSTEAPQ